MLIGIDVGGTKILGIVLNKKKVIETKKIQTPQNKKEFTKELIKLIKELSQKRKIKGIGLGLPGVVNRKKGTIINLPNIPTIKNLNIVKIIQKEFKIPVKIEKDVNCMALAELHFGLAKNKTNAVAITIGTGLGGGIIINKKLVIGKGSAGEVGHLNIYPNGHKCTCGNYGCLEEYTASRAIKRYSQEAGFKNKTPKEIEDLARKGNKKAKKIYEKLGYFLAIGLSDIIKVLHPEIIILSGNISNASDIFLEKTIKEVKKRTYFQICEIKKSKLKQTPAIGAAAQFLWS